MAAITRPLRSFRLAFIKLALENHKYKSSDNGPELQGLIIREMQAASRRLRPKTPQRAGNARWLRPKTSQRAGNVRRNLPLNRHPYGNRAKTRTDPPFYRLPYGKNLNPYVQEMPGSDRASPPRLPLSDYFGNPGAPEMAGRVWRRAPQGSPPRPAAEPRNARRRCRLAP